MRTRKKEEWEDMEDRLEIEANIANDVASRNPWMKELVKKYPTRFFDLNPDNDRYYSKFDEQFAKIYGEAFPTFVSPTLILESLKKRSSELFLRIDLTYTENEIMHRIKGIVHLGLKEFRKKRTRRNERRHPQKWRDYLEVWDLKAGESPWIRDSKGIPFAPSRPRKKTRPWTYEEIAKFKYPNAGKPEELLKAIGKVKKQYRAACKLIYGSKYKFQKNEKLTRNIAGESKGRVSCDQCPDRPNCKDECPQMIEELAKLEGKQQEVIPRDADALDLALGLEKHRTSRKRYPTSHEQFEKMK